MDPIENIVVGAAALSAVSRARFSFGVRSRLTVET
jgi:hypothetical protein